MLAEQQTEWIISNNLVNKGWSIDTGKNKNVYFQKPKTKAEQIKLKNKKPDYILYDHEKDKAIAIIEAKKIGKDLNVALVQATEYARLLDVPIVFAANGAYCETRFVSNNKALILNGEEVKELLSKKEILAFIDEKSNEVFTIPKEVKVSREEVISIFKNLNNILRSEGIRAGIERFNEFANILFLKLLSENNKKSWWRGIKSQSNDDIIGYINKYVIEQIKHKYGGDVFTPISIGNPQTLRHIIDAIDPLILSTIDTDIKGDAFEYFLEKTTSTDNDLGEYFTPRNIVKSIINLVDPKFKETIYDPFCGTGGFLTEAFNYIRDNNIINSEEDLEILKQHTLYGREITTTVRIAKMNMILHGDGHSGIQQINTLTNPDYINPVTKEHLKFDVIVTNMPFSQEITKKIIKSGRTITENHIAPFYYNGIAKNNGDATCVLHCLQNLKEGGRMALVVPEGFLFRKDIAQVRQLLLSKAKLQSVISLPQGTFLPYTGVKTSILYFTDAHKPNNQKEYWFYEAKNIGVTLDNKKRRINGINDLNKIYSSDINKIDKNSKLKANMFELGFELISLDRVRNNGYNLVGNHYRGLKNDNKYQFLKLREVSQIESGNSAPQNNNLFQNGIYPFFRVSDVAKSHISSNLLKTADKLNDEGIKGLKLFKKGSILFPKSGASTLLNHRAIMGCNGYVVSHLAIITADERKISSRFLFYLLVNINAKNIILNNSYPSIRIDSLQNLQLPLPSRERQQKIVKELDSYQKIIDGAKQVIENYKPTIDIKEEWHVKSLKELMPILQFKKGRTPKYGHSPIMVIKSGQARGGDTIDLIKLSYLDPDVSPSLLQKGDIMINTTGVGTVGRITYFSLNGDFVTDSHISTLRMTDESLYLSRYIFLAVNSLYTRKYLESLTTGTSGQVELSKDVILSLKIPLPSIAQQQAIVKEIEKEEFIIEQNKALIKRIQNKIDIKLASLYKV